MEIYFNKKNNFITKLTAGFFAARTISKTITNKAVSNLVNSAKSELKNKINDWYSDYKKNMLFSIVLGLSVTLLAVIPTIFFSMNDIIITVIASITIFAFTRFIYRSIKNIFKIIPIRNDIVIFLKNLMNYKSLRIAINECIRINFRRIYQNKTNRAGRLAHSIGSTIGFVKSKDNIEDDVVNELYPLIRNYAIENISYKILAFAAYCATFTLIIRPYVFQYAMNMSVLEVIFYPFTVAIPAIINIIKSII